WLSHDDLQLYGSGQYRGDGKPPANVLLTHPGGRDERLYHKALRLLKYAWTGKWPNGNEFGDWLPREDCTLLGVFVFVIRRVALCTDFAPRTLVLAVFAGFA